MLTPSRWRKNQNERHPMKNEPSDSRSHERWAHFRFSVIGPLLAAPPAKGQLQQRLEQLARQKWRHPLTGEWTLFGFSTIESWYYKALGSKQGPVQALQRKIRSDQGRHPAIGAKAAEALHTQFQQHPSWSYQLHADNLAVLVEQDSALGSMPSYDSVRRFMKSQGLFKRPRRGPVHSPGAQAAEHRCQAREIRGYESEYVNALWHLDFHHGSLRVLLPDGRWVYPLLLAVLDDYSRLCCHAQWYLAEAAQELVHGLSQAFQKRALPRALMTDNGSAMLASETEQGLLRLSVHHETTLPYSPYQNGKSESFWPQVEGRLLPMLEGVADLALRQLNDATQAWAEIEYNRKVHAELNGQSPLQRYLEGKDVGRPCPATEQLQLAFTAEVTRRQRRSDGTVSLGGRRLEVPSRYGHFEKVILRFASWDLSRVFLCDPVTGAILGRLFPQDKKKNAEGLRAPRQSPLAPADPAPPPGGMAPLLKKIIQQYAATGLPPAYLPKDQNPTPTDSNPS
jgi:putative transposase